MPAYIVTAIVDVRIEVNDDDVFERVTGPGGNEWRANAYDLWTREDVLGHLALNAIRNGAEDVTRLDGWADMKPGAGRMRIDDISFDLVDGPKGVPA